MPSDRFEQHESLPLVETVRAAIYHRGKFLVLEKSADAKNPKALEFPGGKIDGVQADSSTAEEQQQAVVTEVREEAEIDIRGLPQEEVEKFEIYFEVADKDGTKKKFRRLVHLCLVRVPDELEVEPSVGKTLNVHGHSEDNHEKHEWLTPAELIAAATTLQPNSETGKNTRPLAKNSRHIRKLLAAVGYLKKD